MRCPVTFTGPAVALWAVTVSRPGGRGTGRTAGPCRGRSGLHRAGCWLTASRGDPQDSATERKPPMAGLRVRTGKGETVRQERTSDGGDPAGSVNPTRSKAKRGKRAARPPPEREGSPGRPLRWMATQAPPGAGQNPAYRPAHRHNPLPAKRRADSNRRARSAGASERSLGRRSSVCGAPREGST
jgi:hypothetical protein